MSKVLLAPVLGESLEDLQPDIVLAPCRGGDRICSGHGEGVRVAELALAKRDFRVENALKSGSWKKQHISFHNIWMPIFLSHRDCSFSSFGKEEVIFTAVFPDYF